MRTFILPYKQGSESAKLLAAANNILRVKGDKRFKQDDLIINWGNSSANIIGTTKVLNAPIAVANASDKIKTLTLLKAAAVPTIEWTMNSDVAKLWLDSNAIVFARTMVNSSKGNGIVVLQYGSEWVDAPLYTKYIKAHEYRVHVFNNKVIDVQKKRRKVEGQVNDFIKNSSNNWVFCRDDVAPPFEIYTAATGAVKALGLDFGAVDILHRAKDNIVAVLEVNTAPGIEGTTLTRYVEALNASKNR